MLKACLFLLFQSAVIAALAVYAGSNGPQAVASPAVPDPPDHWSITYPSDGTIAYNPVAHVGQGPPNETGQLFMYYYSNTVPGGVYGSELTLERTAAVDTFAFNVWGVDPFGDIGEFYSAVLGDDALDGGEDPFDQGGNEQDVDSLVMGMGGDGVAYFVSEEN